MSDTASRDRRLPEWHEVRQRFEELAELPEAERRAVLARLAENEPQLANELVALFTADEMGEDSRFLQAVASEAAAIEDRVEAEAGTAHSLAGKVLGAWRLTSPLGRGGMAEVWAAERVDGQFDLQVAVKLVRRGMDSEEILRRFARERRILARLDHPAIARIVDGGLSDDGRSFLVLERVDGEPITTWCDRQDVDLRGRLRLLVEVCEAVAAAHRRLVVHRDLKPSNILVTREGRPKLLDFGIAKLLESEDDGAETRTELRLLTPAYAAPEQILGEEVSTATDVYALGVLAHELLTGRLPHRRTGRSVGELAARIARETLKRPSTVVLEAIDEKEETAATVASGSSGVNHEAQRSPAARAVLERRARALRGDLDAILLTALRREPERRYASVELLAEDLRRSLDGRPVAARPDTLGYRAGKLVRRHKLAMALALLAIGGLLTVSAFALLQAKRAEENAHTAAAEARRAERVKGFLVSIFRGSDPELHPGGSLSGREILEAGVARLERELGDDPTVAADLYDALAEIHTRLGLSDQAIALSRRAVELRERRLANDPLRLGRSLVVQVAALTLASDERSHGARAVAERALALLAAAAGPESVDAARAESALASSLAWLSEHAEAARHQAHVITVLARERGDDAAETAEAQIQLAEYLEGSGRYEEAVVAFERGLPGLASDLGDRHPRVARARSSYAGLLDRLGRGGEAEPLLDQALVALRAALGNDHPWVADAEFSRAIVLMGQLRHAEARASLESVLSMPSVKGQVVEPHAQRYLGLTALELGDARDAASRFTAAAALYRRLGLNYDSEAQRAEANLGYAQLVLGEPRLAVSTLSRAVQGLEASKGPESYQVRLPLRQLGEALRAAGRHRESVATLRRTLALELKLFGTADRRDVARTQRELAQSLLAIDPTDAAGEARTLLDAAVRSFRKYHPDSVVLAETLLLSGTDALRRGDAGLGATELAEAETLFARLAGAADPRTREARRLRAAAGSS